MDLFVVNRFGAEENINGSFEKNLSKLLTRIEKRKKQMLIEENCQKSTDEQHDKDELKDVQEPSNSKKKSRQEKEESTEDVQGPSKSKKKSWQEKEESTEDVQEPSKSKKKSRKEKEESTEDVQEPSKSKKKSLQEKEESTVEDQVNVDNGGLTINSDKRIKKKHHLKQNSNDTTLLQEELDETKNNSQETDTVGFCTNNTEERDNDASNKVIHESLVKTDKKRKQIESDACEKYTTLGEQSTAPKSKNKHKIEREELLSAFPKWLSEPSIIDTHFATPSHTIEDIPLLAPWLMEKLKNNGIRYFFPVQQAVIPAILQYRLLPPRNWPRDFCVSSPTGSGKTLAFVLPIVQALFDRVVPAIRALVVLPTQDLAAQVAKVFRLYVIDTPLRVKLLSTESFETEQRSLCFFSQHRNRFESRVDIVVTTPGRLVEHLNNTPGFQLDSLQYLVVDEADLLIERSHHDWMLHLEKRISPDWKGVPPTTASVLQTFRRPPHRLYFSATLSHDPEVLSKMRLFQPRLFSVAHFKVYDMNKSFTTADGAVHYEHSKRLLADLVFPRQLQQYYVECDMATKPLQLYQLLVSNNWDAVIVFANSVDAVHRLVTLLRLLGEGTLAVAEISSSVTTEERMSAARDFLRGKVQVLVSTDSFARGIDLPNAKCVISYEVPLIFQIYVHRVGRTCRAGQPGCAITLLDEKSAKHFYSSLSFFKKKRSIVKMDTPGPACDELNEKYQNALKELESTISSEKLKEVLKRKDVKKRRKKQPSVKRLQNNSIKKLITRKYWSKKGILQR